jgi:pilus assembly protein CpaB
MGRRALLVIAAMLVAAFGVGLISLYVKDADTRANNNAKVVDVVVATTDIPKGWTGAKARVSTTTRRVAVGLAGANPISNMDSVGTKILTQHVDKDQALLESMFVDVSAAAKGLIEKGYVLTQVSLGDPMRVTGLLVPDSKVTIFITHDKVGKKTTEVLMTDVTVVATNGSSPVQGQNGVVPKGLVTFLVKPTQAAQLIHSQAKGTDGGDLWLALQGDAAPSIPPPVTKEDLTLLPEAK